jgi:GxxExxY protein
LSEKKMSAGVLFQDSGALFWRVPPFRCPKLFPRLVLTQRRGAQRYRLTLASLVGCFHAETQSRGAAEGNILRQTNLISGMIVDSAYQIHREIGPGLLESVYERILAADLARRGLYVERQKPVSFGYKDLWFEDAFRADLIVDRTVIVEVKSAVAVAKAHEKQLLTYLRLLELKLGLLLNFGAPLMKLGIHRIVNNL